MELAANEVNRQSKAFFIRADTQETETECLIQNSVQASTAT